MHTVHVYGVCALESSNPYSRILVQCPSPANAALLDPDLKCSVFRIPMDQLNLILILYPRWLLTFFVLFIVTPLPGNDTRPDLLVFGPEVRDEMLPIVDDGSSPEIVLNTSFVFYGFSYTSLYVSNLLQLRTYI